MNFAAALLLLDQDLPVNLDEIRPACKPSGDYSGSIGTASGWGWTTTCKIIRHLVIMMNTIRYYNPIMINTRQVCIFVFSWSDSRHPSIYE